MKRKIKYLIPFIILLCFSMSDNPVFAGTGDFYDRHRDVIDDKVHDEDMIDLIKDYNYESNSFDCGWFGFSCKVGSFMFKATFGLVKAIYGGVDNAVVTASDITGNDIFNSYKNGLQRLSTWMLAIFLMWQSVKIVALRFAESEDGMMALNEKLVKVVALGIMLGVYTQLFTLIMNLQEGAVRGVIQDTLDQEQIALSVFIYGADWGILIGLIIAVVMLIFNIAFMYRFVLFGLLYITGVIAIPTGVNDEYNYFSIWLRLLVTNGVTLFLQAMVFTLGVQAMFVQDAFNEGTAFITGMAFFILALAVPTLLGQLGASSGTGRALGTAVRYARRMR